MGGKGLMQRALTLSDRALTHVLRVAMVIIGVASVAGVFTVTFPVDVMLVKVRDR